MSAFDALPRIAAALAVRALASAVFMVALAGASASAQTNSELRELVAAQVEPWLDVGAGAAVVIRDQGRTIFLDFGYADRDTGQRVAPDAIFNLSSVGKLFAATLLALMERRILKPLGMNSTALVMTQTLRRRAVQGYGPAGRPIGEPGGQQGNLAFRSAGQIHSSARDMATFLAANLGELPNQAPLEQAMKLAQQPEFTVNLRFTQSLGWQRVRNEGLTIVDKNGGLNNTSTYIGMIPDLRLGIVILCNRGKAPATRIGRQILLALARHGGPAIEDGDEGDELE